MNDNLLDSPETLINTFPLSSTAEGRITKWREEILAILEGRDPRLLLICGPCSIHNIEAAREYAKRLKELSSSQEIQNNFLIVMRAYFEKPRTSFGWKGLLYDPALDGSHDIATGIRLSRTFLIELAEMGLPAATEFLEPLSSHYLADLIAWGSIGARTVQSPLHRELASSLPMPMGFKNRNDGNVEIAVQACASAKTKHSFLGVGPDGRICIKQSAGNIFPHIVLRGGEEEQNFDRDSIQNAKGLLEKAGLPPCVLVDVSHDNSRRNFRTQIPVFFSVIEDVLSGNSTIRGIMLESFLLESTQDFLLNAHYPYPYSKEEIAFGASLTDPCLDWKATEELIRQTAISLNALSLVNS